VIVLGRIRCVQTAEFADIQENILYAMFVRALKDSSKHKIAVLHKHTYLNRGFVMEEQYMRTRLSMRNPFAIASGRRRGSMERANGNWAMIGSYHCSVNDAILANRCWHTLEQKGMNCRRKSRIIVSFENIKKAYLALVKHL
jgi:hypothetical protein